MFLGLCLYRGTIKVTEEPLPTKYKNQTSGWPKRATRPPIKDVIGYRKTMPDLTPANIGELARTRFGWGGDEKAVTSKPYVHGVIAAHDE